MWDEIAKDVMKDINEENNVFSIGKVINITERQLEQLHLVNRDTSIEDVSR